MPGLEIKENYSTPHSGSISVFSYLEAQLFRYFQVALGHTRSPISPRAACTEIVSELLGRPTSLQGNAWAFDGAPSVPIRKLLLQNVKLPQSMKTSLDAWLRLDIGQDDSFLCLFFFYAYFPVTWKRAKLFVIACDVGFSLSPAFYAVFFLTKTWYAAIVLTITLRARLAELQWYMMAAQTINSAVKSLRFLSGWGYCGFGIYAYIYSVAIQCWFILSRLATGTV